MSSMLVRRQLLGMRVFHRFILQSRCQFHSRSNPVFTNAPPKIENNVRVSNKALVYGAGGTALAATFGLLWTGPAELDIEEVERDKRALSDVPLTKLISGWIAFSFCSSPTWVDMSESLYKCIPKIRILSSIANTFIMRTFFNQFLGGETTSEYIPKIEGLRQQEISTLLGYNIKAKLDGSSKDTQLIQD